MEFGAVLREYRLRARLSQDRLGELAGGITGRSIRNWESGGTLPQEQNAQALAGALGLTGSERFRFLALARGLDPGAAQAAVAAATRALAAAL